MNLTFFFKFLKFNIQQIKINKFGSQVICLKKSFYIAKGLAWIVILLIRFSASGLYVFGFTANFSSSSSASNPSITRPKSVYFRSKCGCAAYVIKNWLELVLGPLLAIETIPRSVCWIWREKYVISTNYCLTNNSCQIPWYFLWIHPQIFGPKSTRHLCQCLLDLPFVQWIL